MKPLDRHPLNWLDSLCHADPAFVEESDPAATRVSPNVVLVGAHKRTRRRITALVAATLAVCMLGGLIALLIPYSTTPPDISRYKDSEYYALIQNINTMSFRKPRYANRFDELVSRIHLLSKKTDAAGTAPTAPDGSSNGELAPGYTEVTDNQVAGVIEADLFKRTDTHIFYLNAETMTLRAYSIDGEASALQGSFSLEADADRSLRATAAPALYLSADGRFATVVVPTTNTSVAMQGRIKRTPTVSVYSLDISDPAHMSRVSEVHITGDYISSRMVNGSLLLISEFVVIDPDFDDESTFLPQISTGDGFSSLPAEDIVMPEGATHTRYTVVTKLDEGDLTLYGAKAFYSYTTDVYVTPTHIYLARVFFDYLDPVTHASDQDAYYMRNSMTEIRCLDHTGDTVSLTGSATVRGYIKDQYSLDEREGILRVVTTTNATMDDRPTDEERYSSPDTVSLRSATGSSNASLYCIDTATWETVAEVVDFAPPREEVRSVRFDGDMAYVCTAIEMSDPVFFIDLSDIGHITVKDTGTIDGFSHSLVQFPDGYLLGIGQGSYFGQFKLEMYEETSEGVRSVDAFTVDGIRTATDYKAFFIDRARGLIGFGITTVDHAYEAYEASDHTDHDRYFLLRFDGYRFVKLLDISLDGPPDGKRATLIDGYLYMLSRDSIAVRAVDAE